MSTKEYAVSEDEKYITRQDLADDLFLYVKEYYCGAVQKCEGGFVLRDINGKSYRVSVAEL